MANYFQKCFFEIFVHIGTSWNNLRHLRNFFIATWCAGVISKVFFIWQPFWYRNDICSANETLICPMCEKFCDYLRLSSSCFYAKVRFNILNWKFYIYLHKKYRQNKWALLYTTTTHLYDMRYNVDNLIKYKEYSELFK